MKGGGNCRQALKLDSSYGDRRTAQWRVKRSPAHILVFISCQKRKLSEVHRVANTCLLVKETIENERNIKWLQQNKFHYHLDRAAVRQVGLSLSSHLIIAWP